jgi:hypothetical protein
MSKVVLFTPHKDATLTCCPGGHCYNSLCLFQDIGRKLFAETRGGGRLPIWWRVEWGNYSQAWQPGPAPKVVYATRALVILDFGDHEATSMGVTCFIGSKPSEVRLWKPGLLRVLVEHTARRLGGRLFQVDSETGEESPWVDEIVPDEE